MTITAELKETKQSKAGLDNIYRVVFITDNPMVMDLGKLEADTLFKVDIDICPQ